MLLRLRVAPQAAEALVRKNVLLVVLANRRDYLSRDLRPRRQPAAAGIEVTERAAFGLGIAPEIRGGGRGRHDVVVRALQMQFEPRVRVRALCWIQRVGERRVVL